MDISEFFNNLNLYLSDFIALVTSSLSNLITPTVILLLAAIFSLVTAIINFVTTIIKFKNTRLNQTDHHKVRHHEEKKNNKEPDQ